MRKIIILSFLTGLFAGELEVEGNLTVTEGVNASSFAGDGSGLTNLPSLGGMKPERIYSFMYNNGDSFTFTVPSDKVCKVELFWSRHRNNTPCSIVIDGSDFYLSESSDNSRENPINSFWILPGSYISNGSSSQDYMINIFEYSISGSGTDQGMDYVEP